MDELKFECDHCGVEISGKENQIYLGYCAECYYDSDILPESDDDLIGYNNEEEDEFDQLDNYY